MEHDVLEKRIEGDVLDLIGDQQLFSDRNENAVEFQSHRVLELEPARSFLELNFFIVREIDGDRLGARIGFARRIDDIVRVEVGVRPR